MNSLSRAFDPSRLGVVDPRLLFENLKAMCGRDLNDFQLAQIVADVEKIADVDVNGHIEMDEFTHFLANDECDLGNVIAKYKDLPGDEERLSKMELNDLERDQKTLKQVQMLQDMSSNMQLYHSTSEEALGHPNDQL